MLVDRPHAPEHDGLQGLSAILPSTRSPRLGEKISKLAVVSAETEAGTRDRLETQREISNLTKSIYIGEFAWQNKWPYGVYGAIRDALPVVGCGL